MQRHRLCTAILALMVLLVPALETVTSAGRARGPGGPNRATGHRHHSPHRRPHHHGHVHVHVRVWRPLAWWHPIGFTLTVLATTAIVVSVTEDSQGDGDGNKEGKQDEQAQQLEGAKYYYDRGTFYKKEGDVYVVIKAPIGTVVPTLPEGYENTASRGRSYYYYAGDFYADADDGKYKVVEAPDGASVTQLPEGYEEKQKGDTTYYAYNGVWYEPVTSGDDISYVVTTV